MLPHINAFVSDEGLIVKAEHCRFGSVEELRNFLLVQLPKCTLPRQQSLHIRCRRVLLLVEFLQVSYSTAQSLFGLWVELSLSQQLSLNGYVKALDFQACLFLGLSVATLIVFLSLLPH